MEIKDKVPHNPSLYYSHVKKYMHSTKRRGLTFVIYSACWHLFWHINNCARKLFLVSLLRGVGCHLYKVMSKILKMYFQLAICLGRVNTVRFLVRNRQKRNIFGSLGAKSVRTNGLQKRKRAVSGQRMLCVKIK